MLKEFRSRLQDMVSSQKFMEYNSISSLCLPQHRKYSSCTLLKAATCRLCFKNDWGNSLQLLSPCDMTLSKLAGLIFTQFEPSCLNDLVTFSPLSSLFRSPNPNPLFYKTKGYLELAWPWSNDFAQPEHFLNKNLSTILSGRCSIACFNYRLLLVSTMLKFQDELLTELL